MKFPTKKQIGLIVLCILIPGAIYAGLTYLAIKKINANKKTDKKSKDQKINKSTARKRNRRLSRTRSR